MLRDFFVPDHFIKPPTGKRERESVFYESAELSTDWLANFIAKFQQPAIGFEKGSKVWQARAAKAWSQVAREWQQLQFPAAEVLLNSLAATTGLSRKMLAEGLRNHFCFMYENVLKSWLLQVRKNRHTKPLPLASNYPHLVFLVAAGNIPGVAIHPVVHLSLLGIPTLVKNASAEPFLLPAILESLARHDPQIAERIAAFTWSRADARLTETALAFEPQLVVFGDDETMARFEEASEQLAGFGDRFSLALVNPGAVEPGVMEGLAYDICMYEQKGCLSPQAILLITEKWEEVERFCKELAEAMVKMNEQLPIGRRTPQQQSAIQQWRGALTARRAAGEKVILLTGNGTEWTVAAAEHFDLDERVACRFARVWPLPSMKKAMAILHRYEMQLVSLMKVPTLAETEATLPQFIGVNSPFMRILDSSPGFMQKPIFGWMDNDDSWFHLTRALIEC
jgi:hypothetical protein